MNDFRKVLLGLPFIMMYVLLSMPNILAQDLNHHSWKDRIIILFQSGLNNDSIDLQLNELIRYTSGLEERKIVVYQVRSDKWKIGLEPDSNWKPLSNDSIKRFRTDSDQI